MTVLRRIPVPALPVSFLAYVFLPVQPNNFGIQSACVPDFSSSSVSYEAKKNNLGLVRFCEGISLSLRSYLPDVSLLLFLEDGAMTMKRMSSLGLLVIAI